MDLEGLTILFSLSPGVHTLPTVDKLQTLKHDMNRIYANFADNISKHSAGCRLANFRDLEDIFQFKREKKLPKTINWFVGTEATFRASVELAGNAFLDAKTVLDEVGSWGVENGLWEEVRGLDRYQKKAGMAISKDQTDCLLKLNETVRAMLLSLTRFCDRKSRDIDLLEDAWETMKVQADLFPEEEWGKSVQEIVREREHLKALNHTSDEGVEPEETKEGIYTKEANNLMVCPTQGDYDYELEKPENEIGAKCLGMKEESTKPEMTFDIKNAP